MSGPAATGNVAVVYPGNPVPTYSGPFVGAYQYLFSNVAAMAYNPGADELVVAGALLAQGAPGLQGLDPTTFAVRWSMPLPSVGDVVAVSDDGTKAYVDLCSQYSIAQINLTAHTVDSIFPVATFQTGVCAYGISVQPGNATVIAVAQVYVGGLVLEGTGAALFNNGVPLPNAVNTTNATISGYTGPGTVRFSGSNTLIGYSDYLSQAQAQWYAVTASGLTLSSLQNVPNNMGNDFSVLNGQLYFTNGYVASANDFSGGRNLTSRCESNSAAFYEVAIPDPSRPEILCLLGVSGAAGEDVVVEFSSWALDGERVTRRTRLDLHGIIQIPSPASSDVDVIKMLALPNGQIVLHIYDFQENRLLLVGINATDLTSVAAPAIATGHAANQGATVDWFNVPATATVYDPNANRVYAIVPGSYSPSGSSVVAVDVATKNVVGTIPLHDDPKSMYLSSDGTFAYVIGDGEIEQVNLASMTLGWSWPGTDCTIYSIAPRPGYAQQIVAVGGSKMHYIDTGVEINSVARIEGGICSYEGNAFFRDNNRIVEVSPDIGGAYLYDVASGTIAADGLQSLGFVSGGSATFQFSGQGFLYDDAGDVADLATLSMSTVAPTFSFYLNDTNSNFTVNYPNGGVQGGGGLTTAFAPLSPTRFLPTWAAPAPQVASFQLFTGTQRTGGLFIIDGGLISPYLQPVTINSNTFTFGESNGELGQGYIYIASIPF